MLKQFALALLILGSISAEAGFLLEPYAGYHMGTIEYKYKEPFSSTLPGNYTDTVNGIGLGARAAYTFLLLYTGLDLYFFSGKNKYDSKIAESGLAAGPQEVDATGTALFVIGGLRLPFGLRTWLGLAPIDSLTVKDSTGDMTYSGLAYKIGLGYSIIPLVAVNAEYVVHSVSKVKDSTSETSIGDTFDKYSYTHFLFGISVPFQL